MYLVQYNLRVISFRSFQISPKNVLIFPTINIAMNIHSKHSGNIVKHSFIEFSIFHVILQ